MVRRTTDPYHMHLPANEHGRDFFLGDVHGRLDRLLVALGDAGFEPQTDRVICVGDLVDRGPNSYELLKLTRQPWFFSVRGNHEAMLLDTKDHLSMVHWLGNGGGWFLELDGEDSLDSYALAADLPVAISVELPCGDIIGVCHAEWPGEDWATIDTAVNDQKLVNRMLWGRKILREKIATSDKTAVLTVHGHTPLDTPKKYGSALFIDTGCIYGGPITLLELKEALAWPAET